MNMLSGRRVRYNFVPFRYRDEGEGTLVDFVAAGYYIKAIVLKSDGTFVTPLAEEITLLKEDKAPMK